MQKLMFMLFPLVFLSGEASNQPIPADTPKPSVLEQLKADSKELKAATEELKNVPVEAPKPTIVCKTKKVYVPCRFATVRIGGDTIQVRLQQHEGAPFFDVDKMQAVSEQAPQPDTLSEALIEHADKEIKGWKLFRQNVKRFFKHKN